MIRHLVATVALVSSLGLAAPANACLPYIPWLDPFAWMGFYGCGGYGYGGYGGYGCCNTGGYGYGYGYAPYQAGYSYTPRYAPAYTPMTTYPAAPVHGSGCNCTGSAPAQQTLSAVQVPVTSYQPVTQYVPRTSWRTQYQYAPTTAYHGGIQTYSAPPVTAYNTAPVPAYESPIPAQTVYSGSTMKPNYGTTPVPFDTTPQTFYPQSAPVLTPGQHPVGDIAGDHEYPSQSAVTPQVPQQRMIVPVSASRYGVSARPQRSFNASVR